MVNATQQTKPRALMRGTATGLGSCHALMHPTEIQLQYKVGGAYAQKQNLVPVRGTRGRGRSGATAATTGEWRVI